MIGAIGGIRPWKRKCRVARQKNPKDSPLPMSATNKGHIKTGHKTMIYVLSLMRLLSVRCIDQSTHGSVCPPRARARPYKLPPSPSLSFPRSTAVSLRSLLLSFLWPPFLLLLLPLLLVPLLFSPCVAMTIHCYETSGTSRANTSRKTRALIDVRQFAETMKAVT